MTDNGPGGTCAICQDDDVQDPAKLSPCRHIFCFQCIYRWSQESNTCPLCQARFTKILRTMANRSISVREIDLRIENAAMDEDADSDLTTDEEEFDEYDADFVLPDGVVEFEDGALVDMRDGTEMTIDEDGEFVPMDQSSDEEEEEEAESSEEFDPYATLPDHAQFLYKSPKPSKK